VPSQKSKEHNIEKIYDVLFVGGGASALFCASYLKNKKAAILELNDSTCKKLKISGGGKCNITNELLSHENFTGEEELIKYVLKIYDNKALLSYLASLGLKYKTQKRVVPGQIFLQDSEFLIEALHKKIKNVDIKNRTRVVEVVKESQFFTIKTDNGIFKSNIVVVASGGVSYHSLGVSDIGYKIAKDFNINVVTPEPSLVGFTVQKEQFWFKELSGVSISCGATVGDKKLLGDILFAHKGISGPLVLNLSLYWKKGRIELDFLPDITIEELLKKCDKNKQISTVLPLPRRFIKAFLEQKGMEDKKVSHLTNNEINRLQELKSYPFAPSGNFGFSRAETTRGGICGDELKKESMESKKVPNLYFIGEVVDINGELGGYNLQWCASSGYVCACAINGQ